MECSECLAMLPRYLGHELPDADEGAVEMHLADCDECAAAARLAYVAPSPFEAWNARAHQDLRRQAQRERLLSVLSLAGMLTGLDIVGPMMRAEMDQWLPQLERAAALAQERILGPADASEIARLDPAYAVLFGEAEMLMTSPFAATALRAAPTVVRIEAGQMPAPDGYFLAAHDAEGNLLGSAESDTPSFAWPVETDPDPAAMYSWKVWETARPEPGDEIAMGLLWVLDPGELEELRRAEEAPRVADRDSERQINRLLVLCRYQLYDEAVRLALQLADEWEGTPLAAIALRVLARVYGDARQLVVEHRFGWETLADALRAAANQAVQRSYGEAIGE